MSLTDFISKAVNIYRKSGISGVLYQISDNEYFPDRFFHFSKSTLYLYQQREDDKFDYSRKLDKYSFEQADKDDIETLLSISAFDENDIEANRERLKRFFEEKNSCYIIRDNGDIAAFVLLYRKRYTMTRDNYRFINMDVELNDNILFFGYGFIARKYRMRGLFPYMIDYAVKQDPGALFITEVAQLNVHSNRSHLSLGFRKIYSVIAFCFLLRSSMVWKISGKQSLFARKNTRLSLFRGVSENQVCLRRGDGRVACAEE